MQNNTPDIDYLTGISNIYGFGAAAKERTASDLARGRSPVYLLFHIGNFRTYNDRFGYSKGDALLIEMANILQEIFPGDPCGRSSGNKFIVLTGFEEYEERAAAVNAALRKKYENETYLSVRVAAYLAQDADVEPMLAVDCARYALSHAGKSGEQVCLYDEKLRQEYHLRQYVLNNVEKAVERGYIKAYYQPVMWARDETLCGCEALVRWDDPEMGFLSPGQFIPILEESRQIHVLDRCVYENVCRNMRECMDKGLPVLPTSINFSQLDFELMDAVGELEALVAKYEIPKEFLHVEITESMLSDDKEGLKRNMRRLHESGFVIWLDDFGSGYSSLNMLKEYDFDLLKIDMEFLRGLGGNIKAYKIIRSIIDLARELDMQTLCEGVETQEAVNFLRGEGCGRLQGYYYGKPMPYEEMLAGLESGKWTLHDSGLHA